MQYTNFIGMENNNTLNEKEQMFCELFIHGDAPYAGNPAKCYEEAFHARSNANKYRALKMLEREDIKEYIAELKSVPYEETPHVKNFLSQNLMSIIEYCSTKEFIDKKGRPLSPAPLRSVAVAASKALMELYPVKEAQQTKLSIDGGDGNGGITFNVILPDQSSVEPATQE